MKIHKPIGIRAQHVKLANNGYYGGEAAWRIIHQDCLRLGLNKHSEELWRRNFCGIEMVVGFIRALAKAARPGGNGERRRGSKNE